MVRQRAYGGWGGGGGGGVRRSKSMETRNYFEKALHMPKI